VALEAAYGWEWLADLLEETGYDVHLAHPLRTQTIAAARVKTDAVDAKTLAHLLRTGLLLVRDTSSGFTKVSIVVRLSGQGHAGEGEDSTWDQIDQIEFLRGGNQLTWLRELTVSTRSRRCSGWPTYSRSNRSATAPASTGGGHLRARRWTSRCARAASRCRTPSAVPPGRSTCGIHSDRRPSEPRPALALLGVDPELRFTLDLTLTWDDDLVAELARLDRVDVVDMKDCYRNVNVAMHADAGLYRRVIEGLPDTWIEDPALDGTTAELLERHRDRVTGTSRSTGSPTSRRCHGDRA